MTVHADVVDGVLELTLDVPGRRNALSRAVLAELRRHLARADAGEAAAVLLTGRGGFSAGADLGELTGSVADADFDAELAATTAAVRGAEVPVVAALEGACVGAAVELSLSADVRIAGASTWLQVPAVKLGILYNPQSVAELHKRLPRSTLVRLLVLGERLPAADALAAGLVDRVVGDGMSVAAARELLAVLAAAPRDALLHTKKLLNALDRGPLDPDHWQQVRLSLLGSPERRQAIIAARADHRIDTPTGDTG